MSDNIELMEIVREAQNCQLCKGNIPQPNPVFSVDAEAKVLIIGQAPGRRVHETNIPWNDPSGKRLREWMGLTSQVFYDPKAVALVPMGFCYPGKSKSGDLPPRPECAPKWHESLLDRLPNISCTLLIGYYSQNYYLQDSYTTITERIENWQKYSPEYYVLPHPSPRNQLWLNRNPWFEKNVLPQLKSTIRSIL